MTMALGHATSGVRSLTREEAEERGALLAVDRYDIAVDMRGLLEGEVLESTSTITFRCLQPGASTFVDCVAEVRHATLNGQELDLGTVKDGRIPLPGWPPRTSWSSPPPSPTPAAAPASCAPSTPRTSSSTSGPRSRPTTPAAPGPASTSRT